MIHPRIQLVTADYIATTRGLRVAEVYDLVDGASLARDNYFLWVWDVATNPNIKRDLRFWAREVNDQTSTDRLHIDEVIRQLVPRREAVPGQFCGLRNYEVRDLLRVSNAAVLELREELRAQVHNGGIYVPRHAIENFFRTRWVFAGKNLKS